MLQAIWEALTTVIGDSEKLILIFLQVLCGATILTGFYFTYGTKIERDITQRQVDYLYDSIISPYLGLVPVQYHAGLRVVIKRMIRKSMNGSSRKDDAAVQKRNDKAFIKSCLMVFIIFVIVMFLCGGLVVYSVFNYDKLGHGFQPLRYREPGVIGTMVVHLVLIGITILFTEYLFARVIVYNYQTVNVNRVKATLLRNLKQQYTADE